MQVVSKTFPHLTKAPITEALIDIRSQVSFEKLPEFESRIITDYPQKQDRFSVSADLKFNPNEDPTLASSRRVTGFLYRNSDGTQIVQAREDGFTFSRLAPYEDWKTISSEAARLWKLFAETAQPGSVTRLAVRYINRITVPLSDDLSMYFKTYPELGGKTSVSLNEFLLRLSTHDAETGATVVVTQANRQPDFENQTVDILLDIDAFKMTELDPSHELLSKELEALRQLKNRVFFGSITKTLLEDLE